ncbi:MAG: cupin domain-containing protein [Terracidiphilus sp.]|nr:cupin domain-containing protein [Terracidiphilus sp.]
MKLHHLVLLLFALAASAAAQSASPLPAPNPLTASRVFRIDEVPARAFPNGTQSRRIFSGALASGESVAAHESTQPAGTTPSPLHVIHHSEFILILEGSVLFEHDGKSEPAGPGCILYVALGTLHRLVNAGPGPARYAVIQIGGDTKL